MSTHMLLDEKFQKLANYFWYQISNSKRDRFEIFKFLELDCGLSNDLQKESIQEIIKHLYNLNRLAQTTRYGEPFNRKDNIQFIPTDMDGHIERQEAIEILQSLHYQLAEYVICETETFKKLKALLGGLALLEVNQKDEWKGI